MAGEQIVRRAEGGLAVLEVPACEAPVSFLTAFGGQVEVLEPEELRQRMAELGSQLSSLYGGGLAGRASDPDISARQAATRVASQERCKSETA